MGQQHMLSYQDRSGTDPSECLNHEEAGKTLSSQCGAMPQGKSIFIHLLHNIVAQTVA